MLKYFIKILKNYLIKLILVRCPHDPCLHVYKLQTHSSKTENFQAKTKLLRAFRACIRAFGASLRNLPISQKRAPGACIVAPNLYQFGVTPECCYTSSKRMFFRS